MSTVDLSHLDAAETEIVGKLEMAIARCHDSHRDPEWPLRDVEEQLAAQGRDRVRRVVAQRRFGRIEGEQYRRRLERAYALLTEEVTD